MAKLFLSGVLATGLFLGCLAEAWAADPEREAQERYNNAVKLYEEGAYDASLVELNRAAELRPSYKLYFNIAQVRFAMHDYAGAMEAYRQYLEQGGNGISGARREQVQKELNNLAQRVAKLAVEVDVPGAEIVIDEAVVGTSPLSKPLIVNSGIRRITVRHPEYVPQSRRLTLAGKASEKVTFSLLSPGANPVAAGAATAKVSAGPEPGPTVQPASTSQPTSAASVPPVSEERTKSSGGSTAMWVGWGVTGALAVGATVTGVLALSKNSSLEEDRKNPAISNDEIEQSASELRTLATVTDVLLVGTAVAGGVSLWLTLSRDSKEASAPRAGSLAPPPRWALGVMPRGVQVRASF